MCTCGLGWEFICVFIGDGLNKKSIGQKDVNGSELFKNNYQQINGNLHLLTIPADKASSYFSNFSLASLCLLCPPIPLPTSHHAWYILPSACLPHTHPQPLSHVHPQTQKWLISSLHLVICLRLSLTPHLHSFSQ